jgi:hypothetical protein
MLVVKITTGCMLVRKNKPVLAKRIGSSRIFLILYIETIIRTGYVIPCRKLSWNRQPRKTGTHYQQEIKQIKFGKKEKGIR